MRYSYMSERVKKILGDNIFFNLDLGPYSWEGAEMPGTDVDGKIVW